MPEVILRLVVDAKTGRRQVVVDYQSEADALPIEHEDAHRKLAGKVVHGGLRSGLVEVSREEAEAASGPTAGDEKVAEGQKQGASS